MSKRMYLILAVLCLSLLAPLLATAQQEEPSVFTYVGLWSVPRAQWDDFTAFRQKNAQPILERFFADGTIVGWGNFATIVHEEEGYTHGTWWSAASIAGIERVLGELLKLPPNPAVTPTKHRDHLFRSLIHRSRPASGSGYLWVSAFQIQPGKGRDARELWDKYTKPTYDELLANGTITMYVREREQVRTENPALRYFVYIAPSADGIDKVRAAFVALEQQRGPVENRAIETAFADVTVAGSSRNYFARIANYAQK